MEYEKREERKEADFSMPIESPQVRAMAASEGLRVSSRLIKRAQFQGILKKQVSKLRVYGGARLFP